MGVEDGDTPLVPFTQDNVHNRELVINMLKYEEELTKSDYGQSLYRNPMNKPLQTLTVEKILNRLTLIHFGFDSSDESVANYRTIFRTYYKSPTDYDKEVLDSVHYMRNNKVVYYQQPPLSLGDKIPNCILYHLDGTSETSLYDTILKKESEFTIIAAFSLS